MQMRLCPRNHYYDQSVHSECPYCANAASAGGPAEIGATMPASPAGDIGKTAPAYMEGAGIGKTAPADFGAGESAAPAYADGKTQIGGIKVNIGIDPVVGWLVCIEGVNKGRDYRMHAENNFIGRSDKMDIVIRDDETVSRDKHAIITFDERSRTYYFAQGDARGIVRVNDKPVLNTVELNPYDKIEIGKTKLIFVPLCGEAFNWVK